VSGFSRTVEINKGMNMLATLLLLVLSMQLGVDISLFDGKTLNGWVLENTSEEKIVVRDGVIRIEQGSGWIRSTREFKDFSLKLEFRFLNDEANSGVFIRTAATSDRNPAPNGVVRGWPDDGYAVQTREIARDLPTTKSPLTGRVMTQGKASAAKEVSFDPEALRSAFKPTGAWQSYEIQCIGPRIAVRVNGAFVTEAEIARLSGHIGLQGETGIVEFRNISIRQIIAQ
jgi:hypothetical protein